MWRRNAAALSCAAMIGLAGCGGGSDDKAASEPKADTAQQAQQDADAKSNARNLTSQLEACYAGYGSYEQCALADDGTVDGQDTGLDAANLTTEVSADGYVIKATSESGNEFSIGKAGGGAMERDCITKGEGGCPASGTW
jgi:hypothetical protein